MSSTDMPDWVRLFALPVTVGAITAIVSALITYMRGNNERTRINREEQLNQAKASCANILAILDEMYSFIQHDAWYAAWRRRKIRYFGNDQRHDEELVEADKQTWKSFEECVAKWRKSDITFETELEAYFEVEDFDELRKLIDHAASELWKINFGKVEEFPYSDCAKRESREHFDILLARMRAFIKILSLHLVKCIQEADVGNLRLDANVTSCCRRNNGKQLFKRLEHRHNEEATKLIADEKV